jgi:hypothetical protein
VTDLAARIDRLESRQAILDLLADYMRAQDRLDPALHRAVFHDDATTDYGEAYRGDADGFVAFAQGVLAPHAMNHHMLGQIRIDFEGPDLAFGEAYFQAFHRIEEDGEAKDLFVAGRYVDRYERRAGVWKIAHRSELVDWLRTEPAADDLLRLQPGWPLGARAPDDLSCRRDELRRR